MECGCVQVFDRSSNDQSIEIEELVYRSDPEQYWADWPHENGLVVLEQGTPIEEYVIYGQLIKSQIDPRRATLVDCMRGQYGSDPSSHEQYKNCDNRVFYCIVPDGYAAAVDDDGLNNSNPGLATFRWAWGCMQHGYCDAAPAANDVIACESEDLLIQSVDGDEITALRGYNDTIISPHIRGSFFARYSPSMLRLHQGRMFGYVHGYRSEPDLLPLLRPSTIPDGTPSQPEVTINLSGQQYICRGLFSMTDLYIWDQVNPASPLIFRCAWTPNDFQNF